MDRWIEIDINAIKNNISIIKSLIDWPKVKLMAVVKANAYGHGSVEIAEVCQREKVDYLAVASFDEAKILRQNKIKIPIVIIGYINKKNIAKAINSNISLSLYSKDIGDEIINVARSLRKKAKVHLKIDTGMHRLGFLPNEFIQNYKKLVADKNLDIEYIYSHLADFDDVDYSKKQIVALGKLQKEIKNKGLPIPRIHFSRSDSLIDDNVDFDMVRPGLAIYGLCDAITDLEPVLSFKTRIAQIKNINANEYVGYCLTFKSKKPMKIATIACGYADGYGRNFSNKGEVIVKGVKCPVIGRVCMNLTIIDVSKLPKVKMGDEIILIGKDNRAQITANNLAKTIDTIPYEIVSRIPSEIPRIYKNL